MFEENVYKREEEVHWLTISLIVVLVAQCRALSVKNVANAYVWTEAIHIYLGVKSQSMASSISPVHRRHTRITSVVLPNAKIAIDKPVVLINYQQRISGCSATSLTKKKTGSPGDA